jgi:hypothetical protein
MQFYLTLTEIELSHCRKISDHRLLWKQELLLQVSHWTSDCQAVVLQTFRMAPESCTQRILELKQAV